MTVASALTQATALPRPRDVLGRFGIYVHVPFCSDRCWYCDFNAYAGLDSEIDRYMDALALDAFGAKSAPEGADLASRPPVTSVFIGGGTPSLVDASAIANVLGSLRDGWDIEPRAEITIEANPESLNAEKLAAYAAAGVNRVSVGVQTLDPEGLKTLGRVHSADKALTALRLATSMFDNVSADLIYGVPGETDDSWMSSLERVIDTGVSHVSCYALIYEQGTPLESFRKLGKIVPVDDDRVADRFEIADSALSGAGFDRYEISNWALPGAECEHNTLYWDCGEYLGIGAGAHSHLAQLGVAMGAVRSWTVKGPKAYAEGVSGIGTVNGREYLTQAERAFEVMLLGLRKTGGVAFERFEALVGAPIEEIFPGSVDRGVEEGLLESRSGAVRLVKPFLADAALRHFLP